MNNLKPDHLIEEQVLEPNNDIHPAVIDTPEKPKEIIFTNGEKKKKSCPNAYKNIITLRYNFK